MDAGEEFLQRHMLLNVIDRVRAVDMRNGTALT